MFAILQTVTPKTIKMISLESVSILKHFSSKSNPICLLLLRCLVLVQLGSRFLLASCSGSSPTTNTATATQVYIYDRDTVNVKKKESYHLNRPKLFLSSSNPLSIP